MNGFYKRLFALVLLVIAISGTVIYTTVDIHTLQNITEFKPWSIALALASVGLGLFFDGSRLMHLVRISNERITLWQAVQVIFGNYFLALLTPGATGGAVAQLMFLRHAGVPAGKAAVLVIVRTLLSIFFLMLCTPIIFLHDNGILPGVPNEPLVAAAFLVCVGILVIVRGARRGFLDYAVVRISKRFSHEKRRKLFAFYRDTKLGISLLYKSPRSMALVFVESGLNLLFIYAIVPCLLLGLGATDMDWPLVMGRMIVLNLLLYFMPTPGGAGIAEGGFVMLFSGSVPAGTVGIIAVCWRLIAEYLPFLAGFYFTVVIFGRDFLHRRLAER